MKKSIKEAFETPTEWSFHWLQEKEEDEWVVGKENKGERKELSLLGFNVEGNEVGTSIASCGLG